MGEGGRWENPLLLADCLRRCVDLGALPSTESVRPVLVLLLGLALVAPTEALLESGVNAAAAAASAAFPSAAPSKLSSSPREPVHPDPVAVAGAEAAAPMLRRLLLGSNRRGASSASWLVRSVSCA